ncbi:MAG: T9SS type A sorting domain-containing protein [Bacteroidota bacterium]
MNKLLIISSLAFYMLLFPCFLYSQNSTCTAAILVEPGSFVVDSLVGEGAIFQGATAAAWYRFEPTQSGIFTISSCSGGGDTRLVLMLLDDCATNDFQIINSAEDNCDDGKGGTTASVIESVATVGFSYVIYWDNGQSNDGFTWQLSFEATGATPAGGDCATAPSIAIGTHTVEELSGVGAAFTDAVSAQWYTFTASMDGLLSISACESAVNTRLFVFEGGCDNRQILAQNDDGCGDSGASVLQDTNFVVKDQIYLVYWDDHWSKAGFTFELNVADIPSNITEPEWAKSIHLYPNPADNQLFVDYNFVGNVDLEMVIFNQLGQVQLVENWRAFQKGTVNLDVSNFTDGNYFLQLISNKEVITRPFIVQ